MQSKIKGRFAVIFGTSGSGQDSIIEELLKSKLPLKRVVTTVSRAKRKGERKGHPYFFVSKIKAEAMFKGKEFIESVIVYGHRYGTTYKEIGKVARSGKVGILKLEPYGALKIKKLMPAAVTIFIKPPSLESAVARIIKRNKDSAEVIKSRIPQIKKYLNPKFNKYFDYIIINEDNRLKETVRKTAWILKNEFGL